MKTPNSSGSRRQIVCFGLFFAVFLTVVCVLAAPDAHAQTAREREGPAGLRRENLVAWCIVPFDAGHRTPAQRVDMLLELGIRRCAYDWRSEQVPTFEEEFQEYRRRGIELFAFWGVHEQALELFQKHDLHPQIWQTLKDPDPDNPDPKLKAQQAARELEPLAQRLKNLGCQLGLYNHGGWGGEPETLVAVCRLLRERGHDHVGIVYNFHHAHGHINDWEQVFPLMQPYLFCLNLNGMNADGKPKILGLGKGTYEKDMLRVVVNSGYDGPIGIIHHRSEMDAREGLLENLNGLNRLCLELFPEKSSASSGGPVSPKAPAATPPNMAYAPKLVEELADAALKTGDPVRGARVFTDPKSACLSCHRVADWGGTVGPNLTALAKQRSVRQIVESVLWPRREVRSEYVVWKIVTVDGRVLTGYRQSTGDGKLEIRDPASGKVEVIPEEEIEEEIPGSTPMPDGLAFMMTPRQQADLIRFLSELTSLDGKVPENVENVLAHSGTHGVVSFPLKPEPLASDHWPHSGAYVNRERVYDFYTKQAEYFRTVKPLPLMLSAFPSLDMAKGKVGHWGNQTEATWADSRWNETDRENVQAGVFHDGQLTVARGVCVRLGDQQELSVCFNPDTLTYDALWSEGFVTYSPVRHGFLGGISRQGTAQPVPAQQQPQGEFQYRGYYRYGPRTIFAYRLNGEDYLDAPWSKNGRFLREAARADQHPLREALNGGPIQWRDVLETRILPGAGRPYAVDTVELPFENPWKALFYCTAHDFLPDGSALICTMQGDVWHVSGLDNPVDQPGVARWKRFASGLHQPLGLVVSDDGIFVQCRDQLMRLTDLNHDGEADFYECFSNAFITSPAGHDFICGLERDAEGNFYTASGNQGVVRISKEGSRADILATGFRNPDGICVLPDGSVTLPCSEGDWTPASMICLIPPKSADDPANRILPHFGYPGPKNNAPPNLPLAYLPRGLDNSAGGQTVVNSGRWGPLDGQLLHLSYGMGSLFLVLRDPQSDRQQGAVVPMTADFLSGAHRGRFREQDGQFYITGMGGWGTYTIDDGCFQRVRYTGDPVQLPTGFHVHQNGVRVTFAEPLDPQVAGNAGSHFAQCWNYRYSGAYGSPELATTHPGLAAHDPLLIESVHLLPDRHSLFLEIPELQPVNQLHLRLHVNPEQAYAAVSPAGHGHDLFVTVHQLGEPFTDFPGDVPRDKIIAVHPILVDMSRNARTVPNPWKAKIADALPINLRTGNNLTYETREIHVPAGKPVMLTLANPDVVPHNWVLVKPGSLQRVGEAANLLVADPDAFIRHYVPQSEDVLVYTDIVPPEDSQKIYFRTPSEPGRYPFLCTFPGHWMVMNGELIVE